MTAFAPLRLLRYRQLKRRRERTLAQRWELVHGMYALVGQVTVDWAGLERMLDELIAWYQHAATQLQHEHPRSLSRKLKYLRLMQCDAPFTPETKAWLRWIRIEINKLSDKRHDTIHGLHIRMRGVWHSQRVRYDGAFARLERKTINPQDFLELLQEISALLAELSPKVWVIVGYDPRRFTPGYLDKAKRELGLG